MENESVDSYHFITRNTNLLDQLFLVAHGAKRSHQPTIAIITLAHI
jgi:hypothetical protein